MVGRIIATIVMGVVIGLLVMMCLILVTSGPQTPFTGFAIGAAVAAIVALGAQNGRAAWRRTFVLAGLTCLALPLLAFFGALLSASPAILNATSDAERAGATLGTGIGTMIATGTVAVPGLFGAAIFLIGALFLREPRVVIVHQVSPPATDNRHEPSFGGKS
jgi:hypothetical protein